MGIITSTLMLVGISILFLNTMSLNFEDIGRLVIFMEFEGPESLMLFNFGLFLVTCNILFKLGAAPFHFWVVPVYRTLSDHMFLFMATYSKPVFLSIFYVKFFSFFNNGTEIVLTGIFFCGIISILIGTHGALGTSNIKKLIGFSSIANIGFALFIFGAWKDLSFALLFIVVYSVTTWFFILNMATYRWKGDFRRMTEDSLQLYYRCIIKNSVHYYDYWTIFSLFVMIGVPPLFGFFIKLGSVLAFISIAGSSAFFVCYEGLFVIFLCYNLLGSFYYLKLLKQLLVGWKIMAHARSGMTYLKSPNGALQVTRYVFLFVSLNIFFIIKFLLILFNLILV